MKLLLQVIRHTYRWSFLFFFFFRYIISLLRHFCLIINLVLLSLSLLLIWFRFRNDLLSLIIFFRIFFIVVFNWFSFFSILVRICFVHIINFLFLLLMTSLLLRALSNSHSFLRWHIIWNIMVRFSSSWLSFWIIIIFKQVLGFDSLFNSLI